MRVPRYQDWMEESMDDVSAILTNNIATYFRAVRDALEEVDVALNFINRNTPKERDLMNVEYALHLIRGILDGSRTISDMEPPENGGE